MARAARTLLNLRHLAVFREVARRGSVAAAARAVFVSQPAATQAVAGVEEYFGTPLFERKPTGMVLTVAGQTCLIRVGRALEELRDGAPEARRPGPFAGTARGMTATQLEALIGVVTHGGFAAAAGALGMGRPTLHRTARALERAIGAALFERTSFGLRANRDGERLAEHGQLAFTELAQAKAELAALEGIETGRTVIGVMPLARSFLVPQAVLEFVSRHPSHTVSLLDGAYESLLAALRTGAADFLVGALRDPAPAEGVVEEPLFDDPLAIVVRAGHPLAQKRSPSVRALARFQWIAPRTGSPLRRQFDELFAAGHCAVPPGLIECNSLVAARAMLQHSDRVMLLSAHQIEQDLASGLLTTLPHPSGRVVRRIGLTLRRDWHPTPAQCELLRLLRDAAHDLEGAAARSLRRSAGTPVAPAPPAV
jgi:LysR family transcriptional regulator, regulator for genes of the gallate degradation pathway